MTDRNTIRKSRFVVRVDRDAFIKSMVAHHQDLKIFALATIVSMSKQNSNKEVVFSFYEGEKFLTIDSHSIASHDLFTQFDTSDKLFGIAGCPYGVYIALGKSSSYTPLKSVQ